MKYLLPLIFITCLFFTNCSEEVEIEEPIQELIFHSLTIGKDTIAPGENTKVTASASGSKLSYYWSASKGDILGSGKEVIYASSPCHVGKNKITCTVTNDTNKSETKTVDIVVVE